MSGRYAIVHICPDGSGFAMGYNPIVTEAARYALLRRNLPLLPPQHNVSVMSPPVIQPAMLAAIDLARSSVCLEVYIFSPSPLGERFREALVRAQHRGVQVRVLVDALGSMELPIDFWQPLRAVGGEAREFNPVGLLRFWFRDHRKLLVCDGRVRILCWRIWRSNESPSSFGNMMSSTAAS
jgi:cardiolipin synthase